MMGQERSKELGPGQGLEEVGGGRGGTPAAALGEQGRGKGRGPGGLPSTQAVWGL